MLPSGSVNSKNKGGGGNGKSSKQTRLSKRLHGDSNEDQSVNDETTDHEVQMTEPYLSDSIEGLETNATDSRPNPIVSLSGEESSG
ncbi:hypothetical protein Tco_1433899 [Tanacetum coccineum]